MARHIARFLVVLAILAGIPQRAVAENPHTGKSSAVAVGARLFRDIARSQNPSVVSITVRSHGRVWDPEEEEMFRMFGMVPPEPSDRVRRRLGSGFVISAEGEILTNNHVVEGADSIEVSLFGAEKKRYRAVLVGRDPATDSALLRLEHPPADLRAATLGDSSRLEPGDWVMAIGNPFQLGHTVTVGFVSFQGRPFPMLDGGWQDMIQTDASINPGNSGGPLIDVDGHVVGINVAILDADTGGSLGIGFAVPINTVKALLPQLRQGRVVRGHLPVRLHEGPILEDEARLLGLPDAGGALVMSVESDSTAAAAGIRAGDVIVAFEGHPIEETRTLLALVAAAAPGAAVELTIFREGARHAKTIAIARPPADLARLDEAAPPEHDSLGGLTLHELPKPTAARLAVPKTVHGALVVDVEAESPADEAELSVGDIVRAINGRPVRNLAEATAALNAIPARTPVFLLVWRHGADVFLEMRTD